jgi:hypothetical protein
MAEEIIKLSESEFKSLSESDKWKLLKSIQSILKDLKIRAEKNCGECEKTFLTAQDVNIDLFFQDWRECKERCDICGEEEKRNMCQVQFDLMNHIANSLLEVQRKQNLLTELVMKRDNAGSKLLNEFMKKTEALKKKDKRADDMFR